MERIACAAIKGFYYQFLHATYLCTEILLDGDGQKIICEGSEDIDRIKEGNKTYIQVKTSSRNINITSNAFKKSITNFYKEYNKDKKITFIFHTNAKPGTERIDGERTSILNMWLSNQKKGWTDTEKLKYVSSITKRIISDYIKQEKLSGLDLSNFGESFIKSIILEFDNPESQAYEGLIKEKLKEKFPNAQKGYIELVFVNLVYLVIKKSIAKEIKERYIDYSILINTISKTESDLKNAYKDIIFTDEDKKITLGIAEVALKLDKIYENTEKILNNTNSIINQDLIEKVPFPNEKENEYQEFPFVHKLSEAKIPPKLIFDAKNNFYQAEYAVKKAEIFESETKTKELNRLRSTVKDIYTLEYEEAKIEKITSTKLLINTNKQIMTSHNTVLASNIHFDYFHKIGLLHHVANGDEEIIWVINNEC